MQEESGLLEKAVSFRRKNSGEEGCLALPGRGGDEGPRAESTCPSTLLGDIVETPPRSSPSAALHSHRPADHDCGAGGLWQVLAPPCHPGGDAEGVGGRLLEQVPLAFLAPATSLWRMPPRGWALRKCSSFPHGVVTFARQPLLCHVPGFCTILCTNDFLESLSGSTNSHFIDKSCVCCN